MNLNDENLSSLRVIARRDDEAIQMKSFIIWTASCLAVTQGVIDNYFVTVNFFVTVPSSP